MILKKPGNNNTLILIDGHGLAYRAFYAMPDLENSQKEKVGAVYGFLNMLLKLIEEFNPEFLAVSFDKERPKERLALYEAYKANRQKTPEALSIQFSYIEELLDILGIPIIIETNYEADDCIGTVAFSAKKQNVLIASGDKDLLQTVSHNVKIVYPQKGFAKFSIYDEKAVIDEFGFKPEFIPDYKALAGDSSDNIPGAQGIGAVTAKKLISQHGNIENIFANLDSIAEKTKKLLTQSKDMVFLSKKLAVIKTDLNLSFNSDSMKLKEFDDNKFLHFLKRMEFKSLINKFFKNANTETDLQNNEKTIATDPNNFCISINEFTNSFHSLFSADGYSLKITGNEINDRKLFEDFFKLLNGRKLCCFDLKPLFKKLLNCNLSLPDNFFDTGLAGYVISAEDMSQTFLRVYSRTCGKFTDSENLSSQEKAVMTGEMVAFQEKTLKENGLSDVFYNQEQPLIKILAKMENEGIYCDRKELFSVAESFREKLAILEEHIYEIAGEKFNINSPKQLGYILFDKLKLPSTKKQSTNHETLVSIMNYSPAIPLILDYRELKKLLSTYAEKLPELINPQTGRIHTNFSSRKTATGRLSSSEPNLQNIPARTAWGQEIRRTFKVQKEGYIFLSADYSQIELRLMAHFSKDQTMIESFEKGIDIHARTASEIFSVALSEVTDSMRRKAKEINFGILYGMSAHGLSERISVDMKTAKNYIERYFARFPNVNEFIKNLIAETCEKGFVTTLSGRIRRIPDINSRNMNLRKASERIAVNTVIQGSAADIIKLAMLKTDELLSKSGLKAKMILQIHDELLFELPSEEEAELAGIIKESMEKIIILKVPLNTNIEKGKNWSEMELLRA